MLELEDVVVLEDVEEQPIGQPVHVAFDAQGRILLIDRLNPGAILFSPRGERRRLFGSRGRGPGEIESAMLGVFLPDDRIGVVGEGARPGIVVFDVASGQHVETIPLQTLPSSVTPIQEGFLFGSLDFGRGTSVTEFNLLTRRERAFGPIPPGYLAGGPLAGIFSRVRAVRINDGTTMLGFEPLEELVLEYNQSGGREVLRAPPVRRRGTPEDLQERLREAMLRSYPEVFAQGSVLSLIAAMDAEQVVLVHQDLMPELPAVPEAIYMTILDLRRRAACLDVPVPFNPETLATFGWHGNRLGVLQQEVDISQSDAPTILRWYRVNIGACRWEPLPETQETFF